MSDIERIRAEVEEARKQHHTYSPYPSGRPDTHCAECGEDPCPTLRFAERMLKLAEFVAHVATENDSWWSMAERVLAEVAR